MPEDKTAYYLRHTGHTAWQANYIQGQSRCGGPRSPPAPARKTKIECACGGRYTLGNRCNHYRSMKHTNWAEQVQTHTEIHT